MRFISALHPRDRLGRFATRGKAQVSFRVSTRSATATVGRSFTIIPGKVGIHLGVLARIDNLSEKRGYLAKLTDKGLARLSKYAPARHREAIIEVLRKRKVDVGGVRLHQIGGQRRAGSVKISNSIKGPRKATSGVRAPRRKARRTRTPRAATRGKRIAA